MDHNVIHYLTPFRIDEFAVGALIYVLRQRSTEAQLARAGACLVTIAGSVFVVTAAIGVPAGSWYDDGVSTSVTSLAAAGVLLLALHSSQVARCFAIPILVQIGKVSYGMYLYHEIVLIVLSKGMEVAHLQDIASPFTRSIGAFVALSAVTYGIAHLSFRYVESPLLKLKRLFVPSMTVSRAMGGTPLLERHQ